MNILKNALLIFSIATFFIGCAHRMPCCQNNQCDMKKENCENQCQGNNGQCPMKKTSMSSHPHQPMIANNDNEAHQDIQKNQNVSRNPSQNLGREACLEKAKGEYHAYFDHIENCY